MAVQDRFRTMRITLLFTWLCISCTTCKRSGKTPNIVLFYADDLGYGDLSVYGHPTQEFGPIDRMAREGTLFTQWYSPDTLCTPSRAALLTGRLPLRSGLIGGLRVHLPSVTTGLPLEEMTLAESLKDLGYKTGLVGKWHLGINKDTYKDGYYLPGNHGFDYVGTYLPMSLAWDCDTSGLHMKEPRRNYCVLYKNDSIVQQPIYLDNMTAAFVEDAKAFLYDNADSPFFLYFPLAQTHTPMFNDKRFANKSKRGPYGDQVLEMSYAVEEVLKTVKELGLDEHTLSLFIGDHGPHIDICNEGGSSGIFKGGKGTFYEGGIRVPAIARWPGTIPRGGVSSKLISSLDIFPTLLDIAGGTLNKSVIYDGTNVKDSLLGSDDNDGTNDIPEPEEDYKHHDILFFYCDDTLFAVRYKQFKVHFYTNVIPGPNHAAENCSNEGLPNDNIFLVETCSEGKKRDHPLIYNVERDPGELYPLDPKKYEAMLAQVQEEIKTHSKTINRKVDHLLDFEYYNESVIPCCNPPYCFCNYNKNKK